MMEGQGHLNIMIRVKLFKNHGHEESFKDYNGQDHLKNCIGELKSF